MPASDCLIQPKQEHPCRCGRLRIFMGYAPGVGKSSRLLQEAHRLKEKKVDVVVGFIEARDRPATVALLDGLPVVEAKRVVHRNVSVREMDVAAILQRRPAVAIIDDAAHLNPPGFTNRFRYQDILEVVTSGIDVYCSLDIFQVESLLEIVVQTTGATLRKSVPDSFLIQADQVQLVELAEEILLERWQKGLLHPLEMPSHPLGKLFTPDHLTFLRLLTLREMFQLHEKKANTNCAWNC
ncbi:MAG: hypothetical protein G8345_21050 [Magnetococcales bacterium]|nr:hypothetical protein [Magnetococcales bacterium]